MLRVFALEKDRKSQRILSDALAELYEIAYWPDGKGVLEVLSSAHYDVIILDLKGGTDEAFDLLREMKANIPPIRRWS